MKSYRIQSALIFSTLIVSGLVCSQAGAHPMVVVNSGGNSFFHPAKAYLALPGFSPLDFIGDKGNIYGYCPVNGDYTLGGQGDGASDPQDILISDENRVSNPEPFIPSETRGIPAVPEPSALALFGLFAGLLMLRSRWANWHR